jgi:hypothetical protein
MGFDNRWHDNWHFLNQATHTVATGIDGSILSSAGATLTVNAYVLAYGTTSGTWANLAQNQDKWPTAVQKDLITDARNIRLRFLVSDTENDEGSVTIWGKDSPQDAPSLLFQADLVAGAANANNLQTDLPYGTNLIHLPFTSGGVGTPIVGDVVTGGTSGAIATITGICVTSGTWAGGDAAGMLYISVTSGTFESENLNLTGNTTQSNICGITTDVLYFRYADTITEAVDNVIGGVATSSGSDDGIEELAFPLNGIRYIFCDFDMDAKDTDGIDGIALYKVY